MSFSSTFPQRVLCDPNTLPTLVLPSLVVSFCSKLSLVFFTTLRGGSQVSRERWLSPSDPVSAEYLFVPQLIYLAQTHEQATTVPPPALLHGAASSVATRASFQPFVRSITATAGAKENSSFCLDQVLWRRCHHRRRRPIFSMCVFYFFSLCIQL